MRGKDLIDTAMLCLGRQKVPGADRLTCLRWTRFAVVEIRKPKIGDEDVFAVIEDIARLDVSVLSFRGSQP